MKIKYTFLFLSIFLNGLNPIIGQSIETLIDSVEYYRNVQPEKAINFGLDAINLGYQRDVTLDLLKINTKVGQLLAEQNLDAQAIKFYNESLKLFSALPKNKREERKVKLPPWVLLNIGNIYYKNSDFDAAKDKYQKALENFFRYENQANKNYGLATSYDNLALISLTNKNYVKAEDYFKEALNLRNKGEKAEDILYSKVNFLKLYIESKQIKKADSIFDNINNYFKVEGKLNKLNDNTNIFTRNYGYALVVYADYQINQKQHKIGLKYYIKAKEVLKNFPVELPSIKSAIAKAYWLNKESQEALLIAKQNLEEISNTSFKREIQENLELINEIYTQEKNGAEMINAKNALITFYQKQKGYLLNKEIDELESYIILTDKQAEINENKLKYNRYLFVLMFITALLFFLFISLRQNLNLQKLNTKRINAEKRLIEMELSNKKLALINKSNFISQQNSNLNYLLESSKKDNKSLNDIKRKIELLLDSFKVNERFEKQFEEVFPGFFNSLINHCNQLTQNDLRLCACLRLNQSTKEIALILGVSHRTIESQKYRLKKKLGLNREESLTSFIFSI